MDKAIPSEANPTANGILALIVAVLYVLARAILYARMPDDTFTQWVQRDAVMNGPRLVGILLLTLASVHTRSESFLGLTRRGLGPATLVMLALIAQLTVNRWVQPPGDYPTHLLFSLTLSSVIVGVFEELLFRGAILSSLSAALRPRYAILISSALFTVYHVQAQAIMGWPGIFLFGILMSRMRLDGISLWALMAIHATYDALLFWISASPVFSWTRIWVHLAGDIAVVAFYYGYVRKQWAPPIIR